MKHVHRISSIHALLLACSLPAQGISLTATSPVVASAGALMTSTLPAGPMAPTGSLFAGVAVVGPGAGWSWTSFATSTYLSFDLSGGCIAPTATPVSITGGDVLLQLTSATPTQAVLELTIAVVGAAGSTAPVVRMDVHDDGLWDLIESASGFGTNMLVNLGPVPVVVRVRLSLSQTTAGASSGNLRLVCRPVGGTSVDRWFRGCGPDQFLAEPEFSGDVLLRGSPMQNELIFGVVGLGIQPIFLGSLGVFPCILLPRLDAHFLFTSSAGQTVTIPPALRPLQLWTQGVVLSPAGIKTTDAFLVNAL